MYFTVSEAPGGPKTVYFTVSGAPGGHTHTHSHTDLHGGRFSPFLRAETHISGGIWAEIVDFGALLGAFSRGSAPLASLERCFCLHTPTRVGG